MVFREGKVEWNERATRTFQARTLASRDDKIHFHSDLSSSLSEIIVHLFARNHCCNGVGRVIYGPYLHTA
jgi:hypothetical protein